jgi:hypothetical protein
MLVATIVAAGGCTLTTTGDGAGTGAGTSTQSVGDQCTAIATEYCTQGINRCGVLEPLDTCVNSFVLRCCTGSACNQTAQSSSAEVDACKQALDAEDCNGIVNGASPTACMSLPRKP